VQRKVNTQEAVLREEKLTTTKADLIKQVYDTHHSLSKTKAINMVEKFLALAKASLINGDDLLLSGFGKFIVKDKSSRLGRNPQTGDEMMLDPRRVVTFKPSGILRARINFPDTGL
jgi:integration host factor subunit alpha